MVSIAVFARAAFDRLFRRSDESMIGQLYRDVEWLILSRGLHPSRRPLVERIARDVLSALVSDVSARDIDALAGIIERIFDYEGLFTIPKVDWHKSPSRSEIWGVQAALTHQRSHLMEFETVTELIIETLCRCIHSVLVACPPPIDETQALLPFCLRRIPSINKLGEVLEAMCHPFFQEELVATDLFARHRLTIQANRMLVSGNIPSQGPTQLGSGAIKAHRHSPEALMESYLGNTPVAALFATVGEMPSGTGSRSASAATTA